MLAEIADRVCVFAAIDFNVVPMGRINNAVEAIYDRIKPTWMAASPIHYIFRLPEGHCLLNLGVKRVAWSLLGLSHWKDHVAEYVAISNSIVEKLEAKKLKRIGFKVLSFIPLQMTREEISRLMFGSFLAERESLVPVLGETDDPYVQFHGKRGNLDYVLVLTAMSKTDIDNSFRNIPDIANFREDTYLDDKLRVFHDLIASQECFYFDVDFSRADQAPTSLDDFFSSSLNEAETLARGCVDYLRAKPM